MGEQTPTAQSVMKTPVVSMKPDKTLAQALDLLSEKSFSGLPVVDDNNKVIGMLSKSDILAGILKDFDRSLDEMVAGMVYRFLRGKVDPKRLNEVTVAQVMTRKVHTAHPDTPLREVAQLMTTYGINRVPIVDDADVLLGIVTRSDILTVVSQL